MSFNMAAVHSIRPVEEDAIFGANVEAQKAIAEYGMENVINSTIGSLLDDSGKLVTLKSVFRVLRDLSDEKIASYAPLSGLDEYLKASIDATFGDYKPEGYVEAVATPGGSGAIRHAIWNYTNMGDEILTSDWYWGPYNTIASEHGRKIATYELFDENMNFNISDFEEKVDILLEKQERLLIIINSPAHNPTGFSLSYKDWQDVISILKSKAQSGHKLIIFIDIAYIDFCENEERKFLSLLGGLPKNILFLMSFSMSKGYTIYGLRSGTLIGLSSDRAVAKEFKDVCSYSNRGVWSNGTRCAMELLSKIFSDDNLLNEVISEREQYRFMLKKRAEAFINSAGEIDLKICPYKDGFFISIPVDNPKQLSKKLNERNVFLVPLQMGLRFAVCAVPEEKCIIAPKLIKSALQEL